MAQAIVVDRTGAAAPPRAAAHVAVEHAHSSTGLDNRKLLMWAFLASDCMFFGTLIATYLVYKNRSLDGPLPRETFDVPYTSVSAFVLLLSSLTMVLALTLSRNLFGSTFFTLTGFHGTHVAIGVFWLLSLVTHSLRGRLHREHSLLVEIAGLYWHFVDIVWILIFTLVYLIPD
jgi:heme/copper-type cytochrome/quinol oxidase subunit 3